MSEHEWFQDRIATYVAGGLPDEERERFDAHRSACGDCAGELEAMLQMEKTMTQIFSAVVPAANFEDRLIAGLRFKGPRLAINPVVRRAAVAAAVIIVLGGFWWVGEPADRSGGVGCE